MIAHYIKQHSSKKTLLSNVIYCKDVRYCGQDVGEKGHRTQEKRADLGEPLPCKGIIT